MTDPTPFVQNDPAATRQTLLRTAFAVEGGMLLLAVGLGAAAGVRFWEQAYLDAATALTGVAAGLAMLAVATAVTETSLPFAVQMRRDIERLKGLFRGTTITDVLWISLLAGAGEEALFRGVLQPFLSGYLGLPAALAVTSLLFGLVHCISRAYVIFASVLGLLFGLLQVWSGNILLPMIAHAAYDFVALAFVLHAEARAKGV